MRVRVIGDCTAADALRGYLRKDACVALVLDDGHVDYTVRLQRETMPAGEISIDFDSIDCPLERALFRHVRDLADCTVTFHTKGGIQADNEVLITFSSEAARWVELGVFRGLAEFAAPGVAERAASAIDSVNGVRGELLGMTEALAHVLAELRLPWWRRIFRK